MNGTQSTRPSLWKHALVLLALLGSVASAPLARSASAQSQDAFFPVFVLACDAYVKMQGSAAGFGYPPECRGLPDIQVTAYDTEGIRLDACTTDAEGTCRLAIDYNGTRIFEQDTANVPEGYRSEADVQRVFTYTEFAEIAFHNYSPQAYPQRDSATATVRVHSRICPEQYTGDTFFEDCDPNLPTTNQWIFGNDTYTRAGKDGNAVLRDMPAAVGSEIIGGQSYMTGDVFFYCSITRDASVQVPTSVEVTALYDGITRDFVGKVDLNPGDDVTCDWYQIPLLDRGLWDSVINVLATEGAEATYEGGTGLIDLHLYRCPDGVEPADLETAGAECTAKENGATVRATSEDGTEHASGTTDAEGYVQISLSDKPVESFQISLDGHDDATRDQIMCVANRMPPPGGQGSTLPMYQATTVDGPAWTIEGFGDDLNGVVCSWFLVPTA
jgi:hypothetical protein